MKKILLTSAICSSILFGASNPSTQYDYEVSLFASGILSNSKANLKDEHYGNAGIALAKNFDSFINQLELSYMRSQGVAYESGNSTHFNRFFLNAIKYLPLNPKWKLYGLAGLGYQDVTQEKVDNDSSPLLNYGIGLKYDIPYYGIALKSDIRHIYETKNKTSDFMYTFALGMPLGANEPDIRPIIDEKDIAATPIVDGDDDNDGIVNSIDRCPTTPAGAQVNEYGCELDDDNDGVVNSIDRCPTTPLGAIVNEYGCELDDDNDGVVNRLDRCPNTSEGVKVNSDGCFETVDLKINFPYNSAVIQEQYMERVRKFANTMKNNPNLTATIEAHTDSIGSQRYNLGLSDRRANSTSMAIENLGIDSSRIKSIGYGETQPVASNKTSEGRAKNRRVIGLLNK